MGSGLILLVIVGAWLAVLVPMALRAHDPGSLRSADRFGDAMRALSRRTGVGAGAPLFAMSSSSTGGSSGSEWTGRGTSHGSYALEPLAEDDGHDAEPADELDHLDDADHLDVDHLDHLDDLDLDPEPLPALEPMFAEARQEPRRPLTVVERRRRVLLTLLGGAGLLLLLSLVVRPLLWAGLVLLVLAVAYVVHLRRLALARAARRRRAPLAAPVTRSRPVRRPVPARSWEEPERVEVEREPATQPLPLAAGDLFGQPTGWSPVPVPPPSYLSQPAAPPRPQRMLDLTRSGTWTPSSDLDLGPDVDSDPDVELDQILERRRAAGDW